MMTLAASRPKCLCRWGPLERNAKGLPTFGQRRRGAKMVVFKVINLKPVKGEVPWSRLHEPTLGGQAVRVGVDLAKRVIQVHAVDTAGHVLVSRALARDKFIAWCAQLPAGCIVAMETSSSAHHWARKLTAWVGRAHHRRPARQPLSPSRRQRQERRQRRRRHLRSRVAPADALRARQEH